MYFIARKQTAFLCYWNSWSSGRFWEREMDRFSPPANIFILDRFIVLYAIIIFFKSFPDHKWRGFSQAWSRISFLSCLYFENNILMLKSHWASQNSSNLHKNPQLYEEIYKPLHWNTHAHIYTHNLF